MVTNQTKISYIKSRPVLSGVFVATLVLTAGIILGFSTGLVTPAQVHADIPIIVTAPVVIPTPIPVIPVVAPIVVVPPVIAPITTAPSSGNNSGNNNQVVVTANPRTANPVIDPAPTAPVVVTTPIPGNNDLSPCCTESQTTPVDNGSNPAAPVVVDSPVLGNNDLSPCCTTIPVIPPPVIIPPIVPPVVIPPVVPPVIPPPAPTCTLVAGPATIEIGSNSTLTWHTTNATSFTINGKQETPVSGGSITVSPLFNTTYTGIATGPEGSVNCSATVTVTLIPPPPVTPACTLTANPTSINLGGYATLTWTTTNAVTFTINQNIGAETPVAGGHTQVAPTVTTTYTGTATASNGATVNCTTTVTVVPPLPPPPNAPACTLSANPTYINQGGSSTITWTSSNTTSGSINNGIGNVAVSGSTSVSPSVTTTYTGTFIGTNGQTVNCQTTVVVNPPPPPPGCTYSCGGGGGGGGGGQFISFRGVSGQIIQSPPVAAAYVSLSQIPYTGLDLGPVGTVVYWITLILICLAAAYLIIFNLVPFVYRRLTSFGSGVSQVLNQPSGLALATGAGVVAGHGGSASHAPVAASTTAPPYKSAYSINQGFRSFAEGNTLTIDDIVKGLARETAVVVPVAAMAAAAPMQAMSSEDLVAPRSQTAVMYSAQPARAPEPSAPVSTDVRDFVAALLNGDRTTVFSSYRQMIREGGDGEMFLTQVVCAIDDAYRARVEGTYVHPEIAQLTANCATPFLEKITSALTNAVDSSYSPGVTGGKLALTRALAVVEG